MKIEDLAAQDYASLTESDNTTVTVIEPDGTEHEIEAQKVRIDAQVDPDTNAMFREPKSVITLAERKLPEGVYTDFRVRFEDANKTVEGYVDTYTSDHTIGFVNLILENVDDAD